MIYQPNKNGKKLSAKKRWDSAMELLLEMAKWLKKNAPGTLHQTAAHKLCDEVQRIADDFQLLGIRAPLELIERLIENAEYGLIWEIQAITDCDPDFAFWHIQMNTLCEVAADAVAQACGTQYEDVANQIWREYKRIDAEKEANGTMAPVELIEELLRQAEYLISNTEERVLH